MATYAELAAKQERAARKTAQDRHLASLQHRFDATASEVRMKYERAQFAVVTASDAFRAGYDQIRWDSSPRAPRPESKPAPPANEAK